MTKIVKFDKSHIEGARELALANYNEEKAAVVGLPSVAEIPADAYEEFVENGLGVAMLDGDSLLGFLCCDDPWENAFGTGAGSVLVPIHGHGTVAEKRTMIYKKLYQAAAEIWVGKGIVYHTIGLYTHDLHAIAMFFPCGFGIRHIDATRPMTNFVHEVCEAVVFEELAKADVAKIRDMRKALNDHLGESPCFASLSAANFDSWIARAEARDSRVFVALQGPEPIAYIEVTKDGENFATYDDKMQSICGAFCVPRLRGKGIMQGLLNHVISQLNNDGISSLGVDFESFNLASYGFWMKYFTTYIYYVARRIN